MKGKKTRYEADTKRYIMLIIIGIAALSSLAMAGDIHKAGQLLLNATGGVKLLGGDLDIGGNAVVNLTKLNVSPGNLYVTGSIVLNGSAVTAAGATNVSVLYGYNGTTVAALLTTPEGLLRLSMAEAQAENASNLISGQANGTSLKLTGNISVGGGRNINSTNDTCGLSQTFRGLVLMTGTGPSDFDNVTNLISADEIVMDDCSRVGGWTFMSANMSVTGAGGLDIGAEDSSSWYEIYAIRNSSNNARNLTLHRAKDYVISASVVHNGGAANGQLRDVTGRTKLAQGFQTNTTGKLEFMDINFTRVSAPNGSLWVTIESDSSGTPSNTTLATSDKIDTSKISTTNMAIRMTFRSAASITAGTNYWFVLNADYSVNAANYIRAPTNNGNPSASPQQAHDGTTYQADTAEDINHRIFITRNETTAVTMPAGYDQKAKIGYVFNNDNKSFVPFVQQDRTATFTPSRVASVAAGDTYAILRNLSALLPPVKVLVDVKTKSGNNYLMFGGMPNGFGNVTLGDEVNPINGEKLGANERAFISTEFQAMYVHTPPGEGTTYFVRNYIW